MHLFFFPLILFFKVFVGFFLAYDDWKNREVSLFWLLSYCVLCCLFVCFPSIIFNIASFLISFLIVFALQLFWRFFYQKSALGWADIIVMPFCCLGISFKNLPIFFALCGLFSIVYFRWKKQPTAPLISMMIAAEWMIFLVSFIK